MTEIDIELVDNNEPIEIEVEDVIQTGGGGGTTNYNMLTHKPQINGVTLSGNKTLEELGISESIGTEVETYVEEHKAELKGEKGDKGDSIKGDKGDDGFSPVTSVRRVSNGVEISITDKTHTDTQTVYDGEGGGGSSDYNDLSNKPKINGLELIGDVTTGNRTFNARVSGTRLIIENTDNGNEVAY